MNERLLKNHPLRYKMNLQKQFFERMILLKIKNKFIFSTACCFLTAILVVLIREVDVSPIGPNNTIIGLSHLNRYDFELFGVNMIWYQITDWLGMLPILKAFIFSTTGLSAPPLSPVYKLNTPFFKSTICFICIHLP